MLSSTYAKLKEHRAAVSQAVRGQGMYALDMADDSAIPDKDLIDASLAKVDEADAYVGLVSYRYGQMPKCATRNPKRLSLSELEFRRALERGIPICMFIMHAEHLVQRSAVDAEGTAAKKKLAAFIALAKKDRIYAEFKSVDDLTAKVAQTLARLGSLLDKAPPSKRSPVVEPTSPTLDIPAPPSFYAKPSYIPGDAFQGRVKELSALRDWAGSADTLMLFEAIGGMGKSMVTWEWVTKHAAKDRPGSAGILWYSFYEDGASMRDFWVTTLSYITRRPREELTGRSTLELADQLLPPLHAKPWLLALDGLERVLVAYHRSDAAQIPDDEVEAEPATSHRRSNACIRPDDDDLLRQLCGVAPSKILASSRLMPRALLNSAGLPLPGVRRLQLVGLDPRDAEAMLRPAGITGDSQRMQDYLERQFGCHPLVVGVVGGLVRKHFKAPGDFDRWVDDPDGGAAVDLSDPDIRQRKAHILKQAFDGMDSLGRELMARLAIIYGAVDWEVLEALNPARPLPPEEVEEPSPPDLKEDYLSEHLRRELATAESPEERDSF